MESIKDLFGIERFMKPKGIPMDERSSLIKFFSEAMAKEPRVVGIRLAHFNLSLLYALKSGYSDRLTRNGALAARKWLWFASRTHKTPE